MAEQKSKLKVIRIMDPILCVRCDYAYIAEVVMQTGKHKKMFYCSRLDCDNWISAREPADMEVESQNSDAA